MLQSSKLSDELAQLRSAVEGAAAEKLRLADMERELDRRAENLEAQRNNLQAELDDMRKVAEAEVCGYLPTCGILLYRLSMAPLP
jgi:uncharacterized protein YlxW (UPF0749 family)